MNLLETRRELRRWAADKPQEIKLLALTIRQQLRTMARYPHSQTARDATARSIEQLKSAKR